MKEYLGPARYIDSDHPAVVAFSRKYSSGKSEQERAVALYYAVRDVIRYNPFLDFSQEETFHASRCVTAGEGFCIGKAALLAACARADGIPARVGFADVKNHLTTPALRERMGTDLFVYHGFAELLLEGKWVKATPAFNIELCRRFRVKPLEFDGRVVAVDVASGLEVFLHRSSFISRRAPENSALDCLPSPSTTEKWCVPGIAMLPAKAARQRSPSSAFWRRNSELSSPPTQVITGARVAVGRNAGETRIAASSSRRRSPFSQSTCTMGRMS